jgi:predicted 2-oxoglutarate/Fe(II)-dependent dioxygenase YbiX
MLEVEADKSWPRMEWARSSTGAGGDTGSSINEYRSSMEMSLLPIMANEDMPDLNHIKDEFSAIFAKIDKCIWDYRNQYNLFLERHEPFAVLKYENNAEYHIHTDSSPQNGRVMSLVGYFNEGYTGGNLEFPLFNVGIQPSAGSLILFSSGYPYQHVAHPVTKGTKYSLVTWFQ